MSPDDPRHGEERGYYAHRRAGQDACQRCRRAHMRAEKVRAMRRLHPTAPVDPTGTIRRLRALARLGWTAQRLADEIGISHSLTKDLLDDRYRWQLKADTATRIAAGYERLCMTIPTGDWHEQGHATKQRNRAIKAGWVPPLAWDDIDDIDEKPASDTERGNYKRQQLLDEFFHLVRHGVTHEDAARRLGVTERTIERHLTKDAA